MLRLTDRAWSPYVAGVLIGLLQIPAFLILDTALGTSSSYVTVGASLAEFADPGVRGSGRGAPPRRCQELVAGGAGGRHRPRRAGFLRAVRTRRRGISPVWARALGTDSRLARFALAFAAGFVMLAGARIADGCTSGHGISGIAQLAIASFIAVAAMFAGGIATAQLLRRI